MTYLRHMSRNGWVLRLTLAKWVLLSQNPPFLFPSNGIIDPIVLFTQPSWTILLFFQHNIYIAFKLAWQTNHTIQLKIFTSYMPSHFLVGTWPWAPLEESIIAYLHHLHNFDLIHSKSKLGVLQLDPTKLQIHMNQRQSVHIFM